MTKNNVAMADVIDRLFKRLAATYGPEWDRQCGTTPISDLKSVWGHELAGYIKHLPAIAYALDNLPERVPNVIAFKNLCRAAPSPELPKLEAPRADPERRDAALAKLKPVVEAKDDGVEWARRIMRRKADGEVISPFSLKLAKDALQSRGVTV